MRSAFAVWSSVIVGAVLAGCGKPAGPAPDATSGGDAPAAAVAGDALVPPLPQNMDSPEGAVHQFLTAIRAGDDRKTEGMFTSLAREKIKELQYNVTPPGSDTAGFAIGKVEYLAADGARVEATWSDLDAEGKRHPENMLWMLRKEREGWRIAGMAADVFPGEPPVLLDFENLREALHKLQMLKDEIARRDGGNRPSDAGETILPRQDEDAPGRDAQTPPAGPQPQKRTPSDSKVAEKSATDSANR